VYQLREISQIATERENSYTRCTLGITRRRHFYDHVIKAQLDARVLAERAEGPRLWYVRIEDREDVSNTQFAGITQRVNAAFGWPRLGIDASRELGG
jgi:hypothetical protein